MSCCGPIRLSSRYPRHVWCHDLRDRCRAVVWLEAEAGDAVTGLDLRERPETVVRNSEAVAVSLGSGQHTHKHTQGEANP